MRRTETLRLYVIDRSVLAQNMYHLLFQDLPGFRVEYGESGVGLTLRQRRARPHVVIANSNVFEDLGDEPGREFILEYPTVLLVSPDRTDLKELVLRKENVTLVEKPFYPYDLITVINRIAGIHRPLRLSKKAQEERKTSGRRRRGNG